MPTIGGFAPLWSERLSHRVQKVMQPIGVSGVFLPDTMRNLIWTVMFLALTVACAVVGAAALLGLPIAGGVAFAMLAAAVVLVGWAVALWRFE